MTPAYYNENAPYAAQWLRNLIGAGLLPSGEVDERNIVDVQADDLRGFRQCHFFAGIGGWPCALRLAGWPSDREVWTGSPPCQDHSVAGAIWGVRDGIEGERGQLVRPWLDLIEARRPGSIYFENVPGVAPALAEIEGRMAGLGYSVARSKRASGDIAAPHLRRRVWLIAHRDGAGQQNPGRPDHDRLSATRGEPLPETFGLPLPAALSAWMMGFPPEWLQFAPSATQSTRGSRPK